MLPNKIRVLKDLMHQMMLEVSKGNGDDEDAGKEAMAGLAEGEAPEGDEAEEPMMGEEEDEKPKVEKSELLEFFKAKPKSAPSKGSKTIFGKPAMHKPAAHTAKHAPKGKMKHG